MDKIQFREELKLRLRKFVLDQIKLCQEIPYSNESKIIINQLLRSGSSVYANYRAANRARSKAEFFSKISIVVEETDETEMWLDLLIHSEISITPETIRLHNESLEILKIMASVEKTHNNEIKSHSFLYSINHSLRNSVLLSFCPSINQ